MESDCIFCKIVRSEVPSVKVYEDEAHLAFLDVNPESEGHTLVIPKRHVAGFDGLGEEEVASLFVRVRRVVDLLRGRLQPDGYNIVCNNGEVAGQIVHHVHIHVIPRYYNQRGESLEEVGRRLVSPQ